MAKKLVSGIDALVVITVLTSDRKRCAEIDEVIDAAFAKDPQLQVVRVVGYPSTTELETIGRTLDATTTPPADTEAS